MSDNVVDFPLPPGNPKGCPLNAERVARILLGSLEEESPPTAMQALWRLHRNMERFAQEGVPTQLIVNSRGVQIVPDVYPLYDVDEALAQVRGPRREKPSPEQTLNAQLQGMRHAMFLFNHIIQRPGFELSSCTREEIEVMRSRIAAVELTCEMSYKLLDAYAGRAQDAKSSCTET